VAGQRGLLAIALIAIAVPAIASAQPSPDRKVAYNHKAMGTVVRLTMWTDDAKRAAAAQRAVFDAFDQVEKLMSSWQEGSDVARINAAAGTGTWTQVDPEVYEVIDSSQKMARRTRGAFDITVGSFRGLWKFDEDRDGSIPDDVAINARRKLVSYRDVQLDPARKAVRLRKKGQRITLGGVAKGYAVDKAIALLHQMNFVDFILQAGGDLYAGGKKGSKFWTVGIRDPRGAREQSFAVIQIHDKTFSTSGDYERSVIKDGVRYHHILDPKTGRPASRSRSVTVMADTAMIADMWSTALFVIGAKRGMAIVDRMKGIEAVFVDAGNKVHVSRGFTTAEPPAQPEPGKLIILRPPTAGI
jgi:thiamine biosynthesis lipoprotein